MVLLPPVEPMLAQAAEAVPGPGLLRDPAYEQKFDGSPDTSRCLRPGTCDAGPIAGGNSPLRKRLSRRRALRSKERIALRGV